MRLGAWNLRFETWKVQVSKIPRGLSDELNMRYWTSIVRKLLSCFGPHTDFAANSQFSLSLHKSPNPTEMKVQQTETIQMLTIQTSSSSHCLLRDDKRVKKPNVAAKSNNATKRQSTDVFLARQSCAGETFYTRQRRIFFFFKKFLYSVKATPCTKKTKTHTKRCALSNTSLQDI